MGERTPLRLVVRELDYMPSIYRWCVDFCDTLESDGSRRESYIPSMSRFFDSEDLAVAFALLESAKLGMEQSNERTWIKKPEGSG